MIILNYPQDRIEFFKNHRGNKPNEEIKVI
jgi:hypothetical protein